MGGASARVLLKGHRGRRELRLHADQIWREQTLGRLASPDCSSSSTSPSCCCSCSSHRPGATWRRRQLQGVFAVFEAIVEDVLDVLVGHRTVELLHQLRPLLLVQVEVGEQAVVSSPRWRHDGQDVVWLLFHFLPMEVQARIPASIDRLACRPVGAISAQRVTDAQLGVQRGAVGGAIVQTGLLVWGETVTETVALLSAQRRTSALQLPLHRLLQLEEPTEPGLTIKH